jgi:hypothetical protein
VAVAVADTHLNLLVLVQELVVVVRAVRVVRVLALLEHQILAVAAVVVQQVVEYLVLVVLVVRGLLFFVTHQTTTWLQQAEQSVTSVVTRFTRSLLQVITRWWSHEQGRTYSSFDFGWCLGW